MTEQKKKKIFLMLGKICAGIFGFASFLLIVSGSFNSYEQNYTFPSNPQMLGFLGLFICISGFIFINIELSKRSKIEQVLKDEYFESLEVIMEKINSSYLSTTKKKEIKEDLTDMFMSAQESGRSVSEVVGDPNDFAVDIISSYGIYRWGINDIIFGFLAFSVTILWYFFVTFIFHVFRPTFDHANSFSMPIRVIHFYIFLYFVYIPVLSISQTKKNKLYGYLILPLLFLIAFFPLFFTPFDWFSHSRLFAFFSIEINLIPNIYVLLIYILIIPLTILLKKTIRNKTKIKLMSGD